MMGGETEDSGRSQSPQREKLFEEDWWWDMEKNISQATDFSATQLVPS